MNRRPASRQVANASTKMSSNVSPSLSRFLNFSVCSRSSASLSDIILGSSSPACLAYSVYRLICREFADPKNVVSPRSMPPKTPLIVLVVPSQIFSSRSILLLRAKVTRPVIPPRSSIEPWSRWLVHCQNLDSRVFTKTTPRQCGD